MLTILSGDHIRHLYFVDYISKIHKIDNWIIQKREDQKSNSEKKYPRLTKLEKIHFEKRMNSEELFFGKKVDFNIKIKNVYKIKKKDLSNGKLTKILKKDNCQNLITYGCHKLSDDSLKAVHKNAWNVHAGLSPWYRGSITHFWPSYLLEPEYTGMTLHNITENIDGGDIIHQSLVNLDKNDGIHDNSCRCVRDFTHEFTLLLPKNFYKKKIKGIKQKSSGRIWTKKMWNPHLLKIIYEKFDDKINKFCINNRKLIKPNIVTSFIK
jgi:folate-dependent phosphoribosylglycinamide formyltransferase PurN